MKIYDETELQLLGVSPIATIARKLNCSHDTVAKALKNGKGGTRKTALYNSIIDAAEKMLQTINTIQPTQ